MSKQSYDPNHIQIIYEGILKKSPPLKSKSLFSMIAKFSCATDKEKTSIIFKKRWRKRYFVLFKNIDKPHDVHLLYFKNKPLPDSKSLGNINLEHFRSLAFDVGKKLNKTNVFSIQTVDDKGNNRDYYLSANSFELMKTWVDKLVACLGLNNDNGNKARTPTIPSPLTHSVRGIPRSSQIRPSMTNVQTLQGRPSNCLSDNSKFSVNMSLNENSLTYYNMDRCRPSLPETPKDQIDDEDTYKFPCESNTEHSYFNLGDVTITPIPKVEPNFCQVFFGNDQNFSDYNPDLKLSTIQFENGQINLKSNESVFNKDAIDLKENQFNDSINFQSTEHDFNFELPKRIKSDDSSSTSSCYSSTNTNSSTKDIEFANDLVSFKELKGAEPPQIPKRLNFPENPLPLTRLQNPNLTLPTKPPKTVKSDDARNNNTNDEASSTLNYLDATNLLLENRPILNQGFHVYPNTSDSFSSVNYDSPKNSPSSKNLTEFTPGLDLLGTLSFDSNISSVGQNSKDLPLVEYSEINDARTEGLHKLNERILKNE